MKDKQQLHPVVETALIVALVLIIVLALSGDAYFAYLGWQVAGP